MALTQTDTILFGAAYYDEYMRADQYSTIEQLTKYVEQGGHLLATMRSFVANEYVTVWHDTAPHALADVFGMSYNQFTRPSHVPIDFASALAHFPAPISGTLLLGHTHDDGTMIAPDTPITQGESISLPRWGLDIIVH